MSQRVQFAIEERRRLSDAGLLASLREHDAQLYEKTLAATSLGLTHWVWYARGHFSDTDTRELAAWLAKYEPTCPAACRN
ncbi:MAG TPA: hypothetical protein VG228_06300 [Solirubrobacteraceae bacterium]|jgi:hypothetical protein|nr:hypothetical protein [Solirubrobacteraceae bacterium]